MSVIVFAAIGFSIYFVYKKWFKTDKDEDHSSQEVQTRIVRSQEECSAAIRMLKSHCDEFKVLGFNCKWEESCEGRRPVALLQLATHRGLCTIFQLRYFHTIPQVLKEILEDKKIMKVGVRLQYDADYLFHDFDVRVLSTFDLRYMAKVAGFEPGVLRVMAQNHLQIHNNDDQFIAGQWEKPVLTDTTADCAARDARIAIDLFKFFSRTLKSRVCFKSQSSYVESIIATYCSPHFEYYYYNENGRRGRLLFKRVEYVFTRNGNSYKVPKEIRCVKCQKSDKYETYFTYIMEVLDQNLLVCCSSCHWKSEHPSWSRAQLIAPLSDIQFGGNGTTLNLYTAPILTIEQIAEAVSRKFGTTKEEDSKNSSKTPTNHFDNDVNSSKSHVVNESIPIVNSEMEPPVRSEASGVAVQTPAPIESKLSANIESPMQNQQIHVIENIEDCQLWMRTLKLHCDEFNVLSLDCEWVSHGKDRQPVALLQLASHRGLCLLIRLCHLRMIPEELKKILEDSKIIKVGVEVKRDAEQLLLDYNVTVTSTLDLRYIAEMAGCKPGGLGKMSENYLNVKLNKDNWEIHYSWQSTEFDSEQIDYAAKDALVGIELFMFFANRIQEKSTMDDQTYAQSIIENFCRKYLDQEYKDPNAKKPKPKPMKKEAKNTIKNTVASETKVQNTTHVIDDENECRLQMQALKSHCEEYNVLGFHCEFTTIESRRSISLLQLGSYNGLCIVIKLNQVRVFPDELKEILENKNIIKVGEDLHRHVIFLARVHGVCVTSTLDLRFMSGDQMGLKTMSEMYLRDVNCDKSNVARVCIELFKSIAGKLRPVTLSEAPITYVQHLVHTHCFKYFDMSYENPKTKRPITVVVNGAEKCSSLVRTLKLHCKEFNVLGIDCKWKKKKKNTFCDSIALLQLTSHRGLCAIIPLYQLQEIPTELKEILEDDEIVKVGVSLCGVIGSLIREYGVYVSSTLDVRFMAEMTGLTPKYAGQMIAKYYNHVLESCWTKQLTEQQIEYAANDPHVSIELFKFFGEKLKLITPFKEQSSLIRYIIDEYCIEYLGLNYDVSDTRKLVPVVINDEKQCRSLIRVLELHCQEFNVLGIDCKWLTVRGDRRRVALLQLASNRGICALIRLCRMRTIPPELKGLLEDKKITKAGVNTANIVNYLVKDYGVRVSNILDLQLAAVKLNRQSESMIQMSKKYLNIQLNGSSFDWQSDEFTEKQIKCVAKEIYATLELTKFFASCMSSDMTNKAKTPSNKKRRRRNRNKIRR